MSFYLSQKPIKESFFIAAISFYYLSNKLVDIVPDYSINQLYLINIGVIAGGNRCHV